MAGVRLLCGDLQQDQSFYYYYYYFKVESTPTKDN